MAFTRIQELVCITNDEAKSNPLYPTCQRGSFILCLKKRGDGRFSDDIAIMRRTSGQDSRGKEKQRRFTVIPPPRRARSFFGPSRRAFLGEEGCWRLDNSKRGDAKTRIRLEAAKREFVEETGFQIEGEFTGLDPIKQAGGKIVQAWAIEADCDAAQLQSNRFAIEWPPKSGKTREFPEVDRAGWFTVPEARTKILAGQVGLIDQLMSLLENESEAKPSD